MPQMQAFQESGSGGEQRKCDLHPTDPVREPLVGQNLGEAGNPAYRAAGVALPNAARDVASSG
jgi:hypothetical protein